jgi:hypothetical protein
MPNTTTSAHPTLREERQATAIFMPKTDENGQPLTEEVQRNNKVTVHFNPESLDITFTNSVQKGPRNRPAQVSVTETTAKLGMELVFDTTLTGVDVRTETNALARLMDPAQQRPRRNTSSNQVPSIVIFQWGTIWFEGYIDSYREKIDFFSSEGVPLRATVTLSMTQQQRDFQPNTDVSLPNNVTGGDLTPGTNAAIDRNNSPISPLGSNRSVTDAVGAGNPSAAGNSAAARLVASVNGIENIRLPEVGQLVMPDFRMGASAGFNVSMHPSGSSVQAAGDTANLFSGLKTSVSAPVCPKLSLSAESHFNVGAGASAALSLGPGGSSAGG